MKAHMDQHGIMTGLVLDYRSVPVGRSLLVHRQIVYVALPLSEGIIADPFMGSGSTVATAEAVGLSCVGVEHHLEYFEMRRVAVPKLKAVRTSIERQEELLFPLIIKAGFDRSS